MLIHDTSLKMNQQAGPWSRGGGITRGGGSVFPGPRFPSLHLSQPKTALRICLPLPGLWLPCPPPNPYPQLPALIAISQASCYSFLHLKWDGVLVSCYPCLKSFLQRPLPLKEIGNAILFKLTDGWFPKVPIFEITFAISSYLYYYFLDVFL